MCCAWSSIGGRYWRRPALSGSSGPLVALPVFRWEFCSAASRHAVVTFGIEGLSRIVGPSL